MNKLYFFASILLSGSLLISCETETPQTTNATGRMAVTSGKQLTIVNNSDLTLTGKFYCYGAVNNLTPNSNVLMYGTGVVPANYELTYKNFADVSNPAFRISAWRVSVNSGLPISYTAVHANEVYGQLYNPAAALQSKYANWRYLKVELTSNTIPGLTISIPMVIELPYYSNNNSGEVTIDLMPYGLHKNLHITQVSYINNSGNVILKLNSELVNQVAAL